MTPDAPSAPAPRRHEVKFVGPAPIADTLAAALASCCSADPRYPDSVIHTVYFDTPSLEALAEKRNGDFVKAKRRLRWYAGPEGAPDPGSAVRAWIETKSREGPLGAKSRIPLELPAPLLHPRRFEPDALSAALRPHLGEGRRPAVWLRYRRRRFVFCDGVHGVAVDSDIAGLWAPPALLRRPCPGLLPLTVVEVKGPDRDPHPLLARLIGFHARRSAFSKYESCLSLLTGESRDGIADA
jgi:hypothetical protein